MRLTPSRLAQKLYWRQLLGTSNNSINIIKAVGRAGIQRAMDLFGDDGVRRRTQLGNVQQYVADSARMADRQTDRLVVQTNITFRDVDRHLRSYGTHMSPAAILSLMHECGCRGIPLGHDHLRALNSGLKRSPATLSATQISKLFRAMAHLQSDVTEVRLFIVTVHQLLSTLPAEQFTVKVFSNIFHNMRSLSTDYPEIVNFIRFLTGRLQERISSTSAPPLVFFASDISAMLMGAHHMDSSHKEVKELLSLFTTLLENRPDDFTSSEAAHCVYGLAKCRVTGGGGEDEVRVLVRALQDVIRYSPLKWSDRDLGAAVFGLQSMDCSLPDVQNILYLLLPRLVRCSDLFASETIANFLYGLKSSPAESDGVTEILRALRIKLKQSGVELRAQEAGIAMLGLQNTSELNSAVAKNISALADLLDKDPPPPQTTADTSILQPLSSPQLSGHTIANCLYGLKGKSASSQAVRKWLKRVGDRLHDAQVFLPEDVAMCMYGLNGMSSKWTRVASIVLGLSRKLGTTDSHEGGNRSGVDISRGEENRSKMDHHYPSKSVSSMISSSSSLCDVWRPHQIATTLFGLRRMSSKHQEVLSFVRAFHPCIVDSAGVMNAQEICNSLYGLQGLSSRHPPVRNLLQAVCTVIERSVQDSRESIHGNTSGDNSNSSGVAQEKVGFFLPNVTPQGVANALYGLRNMYSHHEGVTRTLLLIRTSLFSDSIQMNPLEIALALSGLKNMEVACRHSTHILKKITQQVQKLSIKSRIQPLKPAAAASSSASRRVSSKQHNNSRDDKDVTSDVQWLEDGQVVRIDTSSSATTIATASDTSSAAVFSSDLISRCYLSLHHKAASPSVRSLLRELNVHLTKVKSLDGSTISRILRGLHMMRNDNPQVQQVLKLVAYKIDHCEFDFEASDIAACFTGLGRMSSRHPSLRNLIHALCYKISCIAPTNPLSADEICTILRNCQRMQNDCVEVNLLLDTIRSQLERQMSLQVEKSEREDKRMVGSVVVLREDQALICLAGIQHMSNDTVELRALREAIVEQARLAGTDALIARSTSRGRERDGRRNRVSDKNKMQNSAGGIRNDAKFRSAYEKKRIEREEDGSSDDDDGDEGVGVDE